MDGFVAVEKRLPAISRYFREPFSSLSHLCGAAAALAGTGVLVFYAHGAVVPTIAFIVYGLSMVALFLASAGLHGLHVPRPVTERLERLDHSAIYLLIAGSYAPLCLITMKGPRGYGTLAAICTLAIFGILATQLWRRAPGWVRIALYLTMGWILALSIGALRAILPPHAIALIVAGGMCYTVGCGVYVSNFPHLAPGKFSAHDLWHVFVLAGCACYYAAILKFVAMA